MENWYSIYEMGRQRQMDIMRDFHSVRLAGLHRKKQHGKLVAKMKKWLWVMGQQMELFGHKLQKIGQTC